MTEPNNLPDVQKIITLEFALVPGEDMEADWMNSLVSQINYLVLHDFDRLISILYRLDIDESKIKLIFKNTQLNSFNNADAGSLIGRLIVERQLQKIKTRNEYRSGKDEMDDDETW